MKQTDLKPRVLAALSLGQPLTRVEVAKMCGCERSFIVSRVIAKLVDEGRVKHAGWKHHVGDRRQTAQRFIAA